MTTQPPRLSGYKRLNNVKPWTVCMSAFCAAAALRNAHRGGGILKNIWGRLPYYNRYDFFLIVVIKREMGEGKLQLRIEGVSDEQLAEKMRITFPETESMMHENGLILDTRGTSRGDIADIKKKLLWDLALNSPSGIRV